MQRKVTLQKKNDPGKFAVPCLVKGVEFPHALCDTGASVSILPKVMADQLGLNIEPSQDSFTFVDCSERKSGGLIRDLEVQIGNTLIPVDFHVLDIKLNWNTSLLLGRAFMATVGAVCDMNTNKLCLTLVDPNVFYDPVCVVKKQVKVKEAEKNKGLIAACHCDYEYETEYSESIGTDLSESIDSAELDATDAHDDKSINVHQINEILPNHCYPNSVSRHPNLNQDDYSLGSWADSGFHGGYADDPACISDSIDTEIDYQEEYTREVNAITTKEILHEPTLRSTYLKSIDSRHNKSIDLFTQPEPFQVISIDAQPRTSIDMEVGNSKNFRKIPSFIRSRNNDYIRSHKRTFRNIKATNIKTSLPFLRQSRKTLHPRNLFQKPSSASYRMSSNNSHRSSPMATLPKSPKDSNPTPQELFRDYYNKDFLQPDEFGVIRDPNGRARAMDGRILNVSQDDIADILQMANGPENLFQNQMGVFPQPSIDTEKQTSIDAPRSTSIACKRCEAIDFKRMNERIYGPELYTKDETNEIFKCMNDYHGRSTEKLSSDLEAMNVVLQNDIAGLTSRIQELEIKLAAERAKPPEGAIKSIDARQAKSIDMDPPTAQEISIKTVDPWEDAYLDSKIAEVYYPLNNNVEWLSTKIELIQKDLDVFREEKNRHHKSKSIDAVKCTSIDAEKFYSRDEIDQLIEQVYSAMQSTEDRLDRRCNDIYFPFDNSIHAIRLGLECLQNELRTVQTRLTWRGETSKSIDAPYLASIDMPYPTAIDVASVEATDAVDVPENQDIKQDLAAHAYDKIEWHTINIENLNQRLQNISDTIVRMDERWTRSDEATRSYMAAWFREDKEKVDTSFPTRSCFSTN